MSVSKSERILNLFFVLINSKRPISRREIREKVNGYEECESESAFERMFERDKDELRNTGVKIDTLTIDPLFDDELGYQVDSKTFLTKSVNWSPRERALLSLASTTWHQTEFENWRICQVRIQNRKSRIVLKRIIEVSKHHEIIEF